ncbi:MAG: hypothetical protein C3F06_10120 [Candidatus Methanoperedenaceae archaeon]|nr:MAG: hypothetical protein C3F06_10120 [Candidatus Methanoperedenaceae archaeon]
MVRQTENELKSHLKEQIQFLSRSAKLYDEGFINEAKRMSVQLRILLHDTTKSTSLLTQLNKKDMLFYDHSWDDTPGNLMIFMGLIAIEMGCGKGSFLPLLDKWSEDTPRKKSFEDWWNKIVLDDRNGSILTRKNLVLTVADQDGGAHIDSKLDTAYGNITRHNSLRLEFVSFNGKKGFSNRIELASIRHIAYEVLISLKDEFTEDEFIDCFKS